MRSFVSFQFLQILYMAIVRFFRIAQKVQLDNVKTPTIYGCTRFDNSEILKSAKSFWMLHGRPAASCACPCTTGMPRPSKSLMSKHAQSRGFFPKEAGNLEQN